MSRPDEIRAAVEEAQQAASRARDAADEAEDAARDAARLAGQPTGDGDLIADLHALLRDVRLGSVFAPATVEAFATRLERTLVEHGVYEWSAA